MFLTKGTLLSTICGHRPCSFKTQSYSSMIQIESVVDLKACSLLVEVWCNALLKLVVDWWGEIAIVAVAMNLFDL